MMERSTAQTRSNTVRLLLIISSLLSLCVSDGVGPRLLPLPGAQESVLTAQSQLGSYASSTRTPTPSGRLSQRMEMASGSQFRAGNHHQDTQHATHALQGVLDKAVNLLEGAPNNYGPLQSLAAPVSLRRGRAPPRTV